MEGKAALFKRFANIDAWPICLASQDVDEIVRAVEMIAPGFGGINLEDIAAPRCFEIEARLRKSLDIPVFHDDQHGTAIVVLAALHNALRVVRKSLSAARIVVAGGGAAGLGDRGPPPCRRRRGRHRLGPRGAAVVAPTKRSRPPSETWLRSPTRATIRGDLHDGLKGADVFIGVSAPRVLDPEWIKDMAEGAVVFALANPDPEVDPAEAAKYAAVVALRPVRLPQPDQQRAGVPGVFRGLLDARATQVTTEMLLRAAHAIASVVTDEELHPSFIIPSVFHPDVPGAVAAAIRGEVAPHTD